MTFRTVQPRPLSRASWARRLCVDNEARVKLVWGTGCSALVRPRKARAWGSGRASVPFCPGSGKPVTLGGVVDAPSSAPPWRGPEGKPCSSPGLCVSFCNCSVWN